MEKNLAIVLLGLMVINNNLNNMSKDLEIFNIESLSNNKKVKSSVTLWTTSVMNPTIEDIVNNDTYTLNGKFDIFHLKYKDENGSIFINKSDKLNNAFYGLRKKLEKENIQLLIKGCSLKYYMIPKLQYSIKATELILGERISANLLVTCIFEPEKDLTKLATVQEQIDYYHKWAESIIGIPY